MQRIDIEIPDFNDSFCSAVLDGVEYWLRFTWNEFAQRWYFGLYTSRREPIVTGLRIVPQFPLNIQYIDERIPLGIFAAWTNDAEIGRRDFVEGRAGFAYVSATEE